MSEPELLKSIALASQTARSHPDLKQSQALASLFTQLASHPFVFEKMPTKDLAKLFVALHEFKDNRLGELRGRVDAALARRMEGMEFSPPVAHPGATPAGVRAAFVDRLSSLKEDVETLSLLAKDIGHLPGEDRTELAACTAAIARALPKTIVKLVEVMLQGTEEKSPRIISKAVELARLAHATLLELDPQAAPDLQAFMTAALLTPELNARVNDAELVCAGQALKANMAQGLEKDTNDVSVAASRQVDGTGTPKDREALDVQLFRRAVAYAFKPQWSEPAGEGAATTQSLFGDGRAWPTAGVGNLKAELTRDKKYWGAADAENIKELLTLLEGLHTIGNAERLTQQEAERLTTPLQASMLKHEVGEPFGSTTLLYRWDLAQLKRLSPQERAEQLREMIEPARQQVQRKIVTQVNAERATIGVKKKTEAESRERQTRRMAAGVRADTSEAQKRIAEYEAARKATPPT